MTAIVLAGGRGNRMKADKASLDVGGKTLLEHVLGQIEPLFDEILVSVSPGQAEATTRRSGEAGRRRLKPAPAASSADRVRIVEDETPGLGPIGGLLAGLKAARNDACVVVACDIPEIPSPFSARWRARRGMSRSPCPSIRPGITSRSSPSIGRSVVPADRSAPRPRRAQPPAPL